MSEEKKKFSFIEFLKEFRKWLWFVVLLIIGVFGTVLGIKVSKAIKNQGDGELGEQEKENDKAKTEAEKTKQDNNNQIEENEKTIEDVKKEQDKIKNEMNEYIKE
jgi:flagellar biosynthesis/type III secretory pathway M-ring protein FliF/YscJ